MSLWSTSSVKMELRFSSPGSRPPNSVKLSCEVMSLNRCNRPGTWWGKADAPLLSWVPHTCQHRAWHECLLFADFWWKTNLIILFSFREKFIPVKGTREVRGCEGSLQKRGGVELMISPRFKCLLQIQALDSGQCRKQHNLYTLRDFGFIPA